MSFDLFLSRRDGKPLDLDAVKRWADDHGHFAGGTGTSLDYSNETTGVYFSAGAEPNQLAININYNRPTYFGAEAFDVLSGLCRELDLVAENPQGRGEPEAYDATALLASYVTSNTRAIQAIASMGQPLPSMPRADALALWRYREVKDSLADELEDEIGEQFMVPDLVVVADGARAYRLAFIPKPTYYVLPPADLFAIRRGEKTVLTRADRIVKKLDGFFAPINQHPEFSRSTESALFENMDEWDTVLDTAPVDYQATAVTRVALDGFVDT